MSDVDHGGASALELSEVSVTYGDLSTVVHDVSLVVPEGKIVSLLGPNGAGKSTVMRAVSGLLGIHRGAIAGGSVRLWGEDATRWPASRRVVAGLAQGLEGRQVFPDLTVHENLMAGGYRRKGSRRRDDSVLASVLDRFPRLGDRLEQKAGFLSGGEQQMLAIGRALMSAPRLLLLDEPSLGLAPRIVEEIRDVIVEINAQGTSVLLVEQNAVMALSISDHAYVMEGGRIVKNGPSAELREDEDIRRFYLGLAEVAS